MKGKDLIKWIQDNNAEDLEILIRDWPDDEDAFYHEESFHNLYPEYIDHSDNDGIALAYGHNCGTYISITDNNRTPRGGDIYLKTFVSL